MRIAEGLGHSSLELCKHDVFFTDNMNVKQFENNRWARDDQAVCFRHKAALDMIDSGTVLDLGSGDGLFLSFLKEKGIPGQGLDISEEGVAKTGAKGLKASLFDFNGKIPFGDNTFDVVVMLDLLEHLYMPEQLVREAVRISKKSLIVSVPNFNSLPARLQTLLGSVPENNRPNKGHIFWFNYSTLQKLIGGSGLHTVEMRVNTFWQDYFLVGALLKFLARIWPSLFALSFVVQLKK